MHATSYAVVNTADETCFLLGNREPYLPSPGPVFHDDAVLSLIRSYDCNTTRVPMRHRG